ncbi:hypothetical protein BU26DRAFT_268090 [Trematosphaeria pertusa]|uniref:Altered inheritance of mitochondria protein 32 n=1 Tax=Trematosphaeria pertusa TaxID=390896 RepID=A0A6A6ILE0_9PLEO|nr:uncharacterized protein BU26DRAFT_268090 [Trematosphaeria pertusa]KAF2250662.1 hypothetical protein BU26DRAFT_268090 [Trematosphaeria pertusa]
MSFSRCVRTRTSNLHPFRALSTTAHRPQSSIPYTPTCPAPTCPCASTPPDLDIDRKTPLLNTMASYTEQVLICTGKEDWSSRIEDEQSSAGAFVRGLRAEIGKGGKGFDPFNNVLITAASFPASPTPNSTTALLFPSFKRIPRIPHNAVSSFASAYLKPRALHPAHAALSPAQKARLLRDASLAATLPPPEDITRITVLICGHGGRDKRCGVLGPMLQSAFRQEFARRGVDAQVGLISHVGGHKYAGNVIIYVPPALREHRLELKPRARLFGRG